MVLDCTINMTGESGRSNSMETPEEYRETLTRRFFTTLWIARARRHLKTLATLYGWSPETLAAHEATFVRPPRDTITKKICAHGP